MFGKKHTADELLKLFSALSDEEKKKFLESVDENEPEKEETVEENAETEVPEAPVQETAEEPADEVKEATEEPVETEDGTPPQEATPEEAEVITDTPAEAPDEQTVDNTAQVVEGLANRVSAIEKAFKEFDELKELMQKFTQAQADKFGYRGTVPGGKKEFGEMSADEMKAKILRGEI